MSLQSKSYVAALAAALVAVLAAAGYGLYRIGVRHGTAAAPAASATTAAAARAGDAASAADPALSLAAGEAATRRHIAQGLKAGQVDPANGRPILYYHDPMVPGRRFDAPGKSPFMDMMLVPVYGGGAAADTGTVSISPRMQQNLGVRTAEVVAGTLRPTLSAVGSIAWNEREQSVLQARAAGYVEKLYVRATLDRVREGQPFVDLYVPEWVAAQEEYLAVRRFAGGDAGLVAAARQRLLLAGMSEAQVARVDAAATVQPRITLTAPRSGVVAELAVREGMTVAPGTMLARINSLATVWALAAIPESQAALARRGSRVQARSPGVPGVVFDGTVQALLPEVDPATRTLKARVEFANPAGQLVPGLFVTMQFTDTHAAPALLVPTEAVIQTGRRALVMLALPDGRFAPTEVETGIESDGRTEIRRGLQAGQRVVVSSQFLIDSEASLKGAESRLDTAPATAPSSASAPASAVMPAPAHEHAPLPASAHQPAPAPAKASAPVPAAPLHAAEGRIVAVAGGKVRLDHGPIASLGMGAMTMSYKLPPPGTLPPGLAVGDRVDFEFHIDEADGPTLDRIVPRRGAPAASGAGR